MTVFSELTSYAEAAAKRYELLTAAWRGLFDRAVNSPRLSHSGYIYEVIAEARDIAETYVGHEYDYIESAIEEFAQIARDASLRVLTSIESRDLTDQIWEHLGELQSYLSNEIRAQIARDIALLRQRLSIATLEVSSSARARGMSFERAQAEYRFISRSVSFVFRDRGNRQWASTKFIRAVWRSTLLATYNEVVLMTTADHGIDTLKIVHQSENADVHGMIISMNALSEHPTYEDVRTSVFHPNANAILQTEKQGV